MPNRKIMTYPPQTRAVVRKKRAGYARRYNETKRRAGLCVQCSLPRDDPELTWRCSSCQKRFNDNRNSA